MSNFSAIRPQAPMSARQGCASGPLSPRGLETVHADSENPADEVRQNRPMLPLKRPMTCVYDQPAVPYRSDSCPYYWTALPVEGHNHSRSDEAENPRFSPEIGALSVDDFCKHVGICRTTANRLIKSGEIHTKRAGRRRLVPLEAITAWLKG